MIEVTPWALANLRLRSCAGCAAQRSATDLHDVEDECDSAERALLDGLGLGYGRRHGSLPEAWTWSWFWLCAALPNLARRWTLYGYCYARIGHVYHHASQELSKTTSSTVRSIVTSRTCFAKLAGTDRQVIRIMLMVPLYAIASFISLFSLEAAFFIDVVRDIYEVRPRSPLHPALRDSSLRRPL